MDSLSDGYPVQVGITSGLPITLDTIVPLRDADEPLKSRRYFRG
jgi:hypothetical protein